GQRRPRHAGLAALPRAQEHSAHRPIHRNGARQVQRFLEGLTMTGRMTRVRAHLLGPSLAPRSDGLLDLAKLPAGRRTAKIVPFEEDDAPYRRDHSPAGGRTLRGMRSLEPTAVSASSITLFLDLGESSSGPRCTSTDIGSIVPSITLAGPPACAASEASKYSIMASSCSSVSSLSGLLCSTLCSRGTSRARIFKYAAGCVRRTRSIAFGPPCRKSRSNAA